MTSNSHSYTAKELADLIENGVGLYLYAVSVRDGRELPDDATALIVSALRQHVQGGPSSAAFDLKRDYRKLGLINGQCVHCHLDFYMLAATAVPVSHDPKQSATNSGGTDGTV